MQSVNAIRVDECAEGGGGTFHGSASRYMASSAGLEHLPSKTMASFHWDAQSSAEREIASVLKLTSAASSSTWPMMICIMHARMDDAREPSAPVHVAWACVMAWYEGGARRGGTCEAAASRSPTFLRTASSEMIVTCNQGVIKE